MATSGPPDFGKTNIILKNGYKIPAVGIGTYRVRNYEDMYMLVDGALAAGYRLFDTASVYNNEHWLGAALRTLLPKYELDRRDIFITTKLGPSDHGKDAALKAFTKSLNNLNLGYIDMYLIHFPGASKVDSKSPKNAELRAESWKALEELYSEGKLNAIGVSNYTVKHLEEIISNHSNVPVVNQVEWHPFYYQMDLLDFCRKNSIVMQAYCSFGGTSNGDSSLLEHPLVNCIANNHSISAAQVLLLWALQQGIMVIPKSTKSEHIHQNIQLQDRLSSNEIELLFDLGLQPKIAWDPTSIK
ncbi:glyoxal reductase-like [Leptidea sinapis]|uniref:glyoxal reductase-like n=1 Tax=Leptidea sinapis TaxID=189913 RepID=UPI00212C0772|nr:glyoxal reductase-like [Leptidea sinapis]XP_050683659.1 glyoxal reductase-like [Leptidea sinapis]XP_050683661.1 glyoxal reductase-like [Leptidea sinapis]XP_050683662.1 glyoxal reductase-like [Leptidea sinapis]